MNCVCMCSCPGKKQDLWYVVDLLTGEKQQTLTSSFAEMLCPSSSLLYLGRTGKQTQHKFSYLFPHKLSQLDYHCSPSRLAVDLNVANQQAYLFSTL